jgi:hypothetical protein
MYGEEDQSNKRFYQAKPGLSHEPTGAPYSGTIDTLRQLVALAEKIPPDNRRAVLAFLAEYYGWRLGG